MTPADITNAGKKTTIDIHSCSLYCDRPECIRRQRDELRDVVTSLTEAHVHLRDLVCALWRWLRHWPDYGGPPSYPTPEPLQEVYDALTSAENLLMKIND